jgi:hypothetical protein
VVGSVFTTTTTELPTCFREDKKKNEEPYYNIYDILLCSGVSYTGGGLGAKKNSW